MKCKENLFFLFAPTEVGFFFLLSSSSGGCESGARFFLWMVFARSPLTPTIWEWENAKESFSERHTLLVKRRRSWRWEERDEMPFMVGEFVFFWKMAFRDETATGLMLRDAEWWESTWLWLVAAGYGWWKQETRCFWSDSLDDELQRRVSTNQKKQIVWWSDWWRWMDLEKWMKAGKILVIEHNIEIIFIAQ